jgi:hypothetical protein
MAVVGLIGLSANSAFSQQVKKKIVRVIEIDDNGERVVKEFNVSNDAAKFDSISRDVRKKIKVERIKMDSLEHILMIALPKHSEFPTMPDMPDMPDFDVDFDMPEASFFGSDSDFENFAPGSNGGSAKIFYSEKNFDKSGDLDKILEDLEKGTFDPQKWNMKEVEKDKIKDFKTKGKGEVIILGNRTVASPRIRHFYGNLHRDCERLNDRGDARISRNGRRMVIYSTDSIIDDDDRMNTFTIESSDDSDEARCEKVVVIKSEGKDKNISWNVNDDGKKNVKTVVIVNDNKTQKLDFTSLSVDERKMLENSDLMQEDETKLLSPESLILIPKKEKDKYSINFQEKETGKVKVIIADAKGKAIKTEEFDHAKGKTETEIELKDLKSGVYFIQAQLNGKTITSKMEIRID